MELYIIFALLAVLSMIKNCNRYYVIRLCVLIGEDDQRGIMRHTS